MKLQLAESGLKVSLKMQENIVKIKESNKKPSLTPENAKTRLILAKGHTDESVISGCSLKNVQFK